MLVTFPGMVTDVKPVQSENVPLPMSVTFSGIVMDVKPVQPENVPAMLVKPLPKETDVRFVQL